MDGTGGLTRMSGGIMNNNSNTNNNQHSSSSSSFPSTTSNSGSLTPTSGITTPGNRELRLRKIGGRSFNSDISSTASGTTTPVHGTSSTTHTTTNTNNGLFSNPYTGLTGTSGPSSGTATPRLSNQETVSLANTSLSSIASSVSSLSSVPSVVTNNALLLPALTTTTNNNNNNYDTIGTTTVTNISSSSSPFVPKMSAPSTPNPPRYPSTFTSPVKMPLHPQTPLPSTPSTSSSSSSSSYPTGSTIPTLPLSNRNTPLPSSSSSSLQRHSNNGSQSHLPSLINENTLPDNTINGTTTTYDTSHESTEASYYRSTNSYSQRHSALKNAYVPSSSSHQRNSSRSRNDSDNEDTNNNNNDYDDNDNEDSNNHVHDNHRRNRKYKNEAYYETDTRTSNLSHNNDSSRFSGALGLSSSSSSSADNNALMNDNPAPRIHLFTKFIYSYQSKLVPFFILGIALFTRFYRLSQPGGVCFDESHFVRFTNQYTARTYFFDIHPPLGKLTLWLMGQIVGLNTPNPSTRPFMSLATDCNYEHISEDYANGCKYVYLRSVAAFHSSLTVLLMYLIARNWGATVWGGILASGLLLFDMLNHIQGRLVLLDVQLSFWTMMALYCAQLWWKRLEEHWQAEEEIETVIEIEEMRARLLDRGMNSAAQSLSAMNTLPPQSTKSSSSSQSSSLSSTDRFINGSTNGITPQLSPMIGPASPTDNYVTAYAFPLSKTSSTLSYLYNKIFSSNKKYDDKSTENDSSWSYFIRNVLRKISVPKANPVRSSSRTPQYYTSSSSSSKLSTKPAVSSSVDSPSVSRGLLSDTERNLWCLLMGFVCANAFSVKMTGLVTPFLIAIESFFAIWFIRKGVPILDGIKIAFVATLTYSFWFFLHFIILIRHGDGDEEFMTERFQSTLLESKYYDPNATWEGFWWTLYTLNRRMIVHNANILAPHPWMSSWYEWILNLRGVSYYGKDGQHSYTAAVYLIGNHAIHMGVILGIIGFMIAIGLYLRLRPAVAALVRKQILNFSSYYYGISSSSSAANNSATSNLLLKDGSAFNLWLASNTAGSSESTLANASNQSSDQLSHLRAFFCQGSFLLLGYILNLVPYLGVARSTFIYHYMPALLYGELLLSRVVEHWAGRHTPTAVKIILLIVGSVWLHYTPWIYGFPLTNDGHARRRWNPRWD